MSDIAGIIPINQDGDSQQEFKNKLFIAKDGQACHGLSPDGDLYRMVAINREGDPLGPQAISQHQTIYLAPETPMAGLSIAYGVIQSICGDEAARKVFNKEAIQILGDAINAQSRNSDD